MEPRQYSIGTREDVTMAEFTKELFLQCLQEWGRYREAFRDLPAQEQTEFLEAQGYASVRDLLTHVAAWWEEGRGIIADSIKKGDTAGRQYDLDAFNAEALKRFRGMSDGEFTSWYDAERQRMLTVVSGLTIEQLGVRRVQNWLDAILLEHLKEHGFDAPSFLVVDMLEREWGDYRARFSEQTPEKQAEFLKKQGFARFRDVLAHIMAWWEQGISVIQASSAEDPSDVENVDAFNAQAIARFGVLDEALFLTKFEETRLTLATLVDMLPEEVLTRPNVRDWLREDVLAHYYDHAI